MALNGTCSYPAEWMVKLEDLAKPPDVTSERIKSLLSKALMTPEILKPSEIQEIAAAVVYHLLAEKER